MHLQSVLTAVLFSCQVLAATTTDWRSRSIYQVFTDRFARTDQSTSAVCDPAQGVYCGGTWQGIIKKLDYIQGMGFDAIWISPITTQIEGKTKYGDAYHGYWQQDITTVNAHFGSSSDLKALSDAVHARGMYLMLDVAVNHFAWNGNSSSVDYSKFKPFSSPTQYHSYCPSISDLFANLTATYDCWLGDQTVSLPDLKTEDPGVVATWSDWIQKTVSAYNIDGLRLDSALQVNPNFWWAFQAASKVFMIGEVYSGIAAQACTAQPALPAVLNYPTYFRARDAMTNTKGNMSSLVDMMLEVQGHCSDVNILGSFSENHDIARIPSITNDMIVAQNIITFTILTDGIPIIYNGQEQHYAGGLNPMDREAIWLSGYNTKAVLYQLIGRLNRARAMAIKADSTYIFSKTQVLFSNSSILATRKGDLVTVLTNQGSGGPTYKLSVPKAYPAGTDITELLTCTKAQVDKAGTLSVAMSAGAPRVFYPTAKLTTRCSTSKYKVPHA